MRFQTLLSIRNAKDAGERNLANQRLSVDRNSVADVDMPTRIQWADGGSLGEIAHKGKSDRPLASRSQPSAT
jgi:hypothetical protein